MIRALVFFAVVMVLALGASWLADRPGEIDIMWNGYRIHTSLMVGAAALLATVAVLLLCWSLLRTLLRTPDLVSLFLRNRRSAKGYRAISQGLVAVGAGDVHTARRFAQDARRLAPHEPLTLLLGAQAAQLSGDRDAASRAFTALAARDDTRPLGLRGLFVEAQRNADASIARARAEEAARLTPMPGWAGQAVLELRCADADWTQALAALERNLRGGLIDRALYRRHRAVLLTARALAAADSEHDDAKQWVMEAVSLAPMLVPAAAMAARLLAQSGELRKGGRILEKAWRAHPHPDLAEAYVHLRFGDSARDRLTRAQNLARKTPTHLESALMVAQAALDAQDFALARAQLAPHLAPPTQRVALLMAEIERAEHGDVGRAREWMARAVHAARDPVWTADGYVSAHWLPVSPVSARIDAFEWKVPLEELGPAAPALDPVTDLLLADAPATGEASSSAAMSAPAAEIKAGPDSPPEMVRVEGGAPAAADAQPAKPSLLLLSDVAGASDVSNLRRRRAAVPGADSAARPTADVIPLIHAPDDPGPDPDTPDPSPGFWRGH